MGKNPNQKKKKQQNPAATSSSKQTAADAAEMADLGANPTGNVEVNSDLEPSIQEQEVGSQHLENIHGYSSMEGPLYGVESDSESPPSSPKKPVKTQVSAPELVVGSDPMVDSEGKDHPLEELLSTAIKRSNKEAARQVFDKMQKAEKQKNKQDTHQVFDKKSNPAAAQTETAKKVSNASSSTTDSSRTLGSEDTSSSMASPKKPWAGLFNNSRAVSEGMQLQFHPAKTGEEEGVVFSDDEPMFDAKKYWEQTLIGYIAGKFTGKAAILKECQSWGQDCEFYTHVSGWLVFRFKTIEGLNAVLEMGPRFIYGRPLILRTVPPLFRFGNDELCKVPIWVKLPSLPLEFWHSHRLGRILSRIGTPLRTDSFTTKLQRQSYARALVEVDISNTPLKQVSIFSHGKSFVQEIEYEYIPHYCHMCHAIGHLESNCSQNPNAAKSHAVGKGKEKKATDKVQGQQSGTPEPAHDNVQGQQAGAHEPAPDKVEGQQAKTPTPTEEPFKVVVPRNKQKKGNKQPEQQQVQRGSTSTSQLDQGKKDKGKAPIGNTPRSDAAETTKNRDKTIKIGGNHPPISE